MVYPMPDYDPYIPTGSQRRRRLLFIPALLAGVFCIGGIVAFVQNDVWLIGRHGPALQFAGRDAHYLGAFCFSVAAYWVFQCLRPYRVRDWILISPFLPAVIASVVLLLLKR